MMLVLLFLITACSKFGGSSWDKDMEDDSLFEGDIVLDDRQKEILSKNAHGFASIKDVRKLWVSKVIPYKMSADIYQNTNYRNNVLQAMKNIESNSCLKFRPKQRDMSFLNFYQGSGGCSSPVGLRYGGNLISLSDRCLTKVGSIIHEIMHSLGFFHEQTRPDRDGFISLKLENVRFQSRHNFKKQRASVIDSLGTKYDYLSIMHYSQRSFGIGGKVTIVTKDASMQDKIGQRDGLSEIDIKQLNLLYKCVKLPTTPAKPTKAKATTTMKPLTTIFSSTILKVTTENSNSNCYDKVSNCASMKAQCNQDDTWKSFMKNYCKKTCSYC